MSLRRSQPWIRGTISASTQHTLRVLLSGTTIKVFFNGTVKINTTDANFAAGGLGLAGAGAVITAVKIGYDGNADDDIADAGTDPIVYNETFDAKGSAVTYDDNGNLTDDGTFQYAYDAWNRLVSVKTLEERPHDRRVRLRWNELADRKESDGALCLAWG